MINKKCSDFFICLNVKMNLRVFFFQKMTSRKKRATNSFLHKKYFTIFHFSNSKWHLWLEACVNKWFHSTSKMKARFSKTAINNRKQAHDLSCFGSENHEILSHQFTIFHRIWIPHDENGAIVCVSFFVSFYLVLPYLWMVLFIVNFLILASSKEMSHHETGITWEKKVERTFTWLMFQRTHKKYTKWERECTCVCVCDTEQKVWFLM